MQSLVNDRVQSQIARHRQILMILQTTPQVGQLNCRDWDWDATILFRVKFLFAGIDQRAIAVGEVLVVVWPAWLAAIVKGHWYSTRGSGLRRMVRGTCQAKTQRVSSACHLS